MSRDQLKTLQSKAAAASDAYQSFKSDGSLDDELKERRLYRAVASAKAAYTIALDHHLDNEPAS